MEPYTTTCAGYRCREIIIISSKKSSWLCPECVSDELDFHENEWVEE
jgi:hypothetical protein